MRNITTILQLSLFILLCFSLQGQENQLKTADEHFNSYAYIDAQRIYLKVADQGFKSADLYKKLGDSYYFNAELEDALTWYSKLHTEYKADMTKEYLFRYSQTLKATKHYKESDNAMEEFEAVGGSGEKRAELFDDERNYLDFIGMQSGRFILADVGVNTDQSDFAPSFYKDGIVFSSARGAVSQKIIHQWNEMPFLNLFTVSNETISTNDGVSRLKGSANTKFHESSTSFSQDGTTMYFTRNNFTDHVIRKDNKGTILLKMYRATNKDGKWKDIEELPFNSDTYSVAHPALSKDGKKLYFASDMPGGKGLSDLYVVAVNEDGSFGKPQNLGATINTEGRETFPYISDIDRLYFASDGHIGLGGLDVFIAMPDGVSFKKPINIGEPVNSPDDDFSFILKEDKKIGYFASNRDGGLGSDDIYTFKQTKELITECKQYVSGVVTDANSNNPITGAAVVILGDDMEEINTFTTGPDGKYEFDLACSESFVVRGKKQTYDPAEKPLASDARYEFKHDLPLVLNKGVELNKETPIALGEDLGKILQLEPIYFDFDKSFIRADAEIELQKVIAAMKEYPALKIDVRSHTDSRANDAYNEALSTRRNKSTIAYIINKGGIAASRLTGRGYGERELVNECSNEVPCSKAKHQLNRRSEFIIMQK